MTNKKEEGCKCQCCGKRYTVDVLVPDDVWSIIRPRHNSDKSSGLLCGSCIMSRIEDLHKFEAFKLIRLRDKE